MKTVVLLAAASMLTVQLQAQSPSADPLSASAKGIYAMVKGYVLKSADEMPEANYSFKPTADVRTFGQLVGHVADAQYEFCSVILGDGNHGPGVEKNATTKAALIDGLKTAFSYCDKAYDSMTDAKAAEMASFFGRKMPELSVLTFNTAHTFEHYGNMITYLRMKGLVPPSSQH